MKFPNARLIILGMLLLFATLLACGQTADHGGSDANGAFTNQVTFVLTRHAEKGAGEDPPLTDEGRRRAERLATRLADGDVRAVYATNTTRTQSTAGPTAERHGLPVTTYDADDPAAFARSLVEGHRSGTVLIVGHSNTIPDLVNALGGKTSYGAIDESDFGNLYTVTVGRRGKRKVSRDRY